MKLLVLIFLVSCTTERFEDAYFDWMEGVAEKEGKRILAQCLEEAEGNTYIKQDCIVREGTE